MSSIGFWILSRAYETSNGELFINLSNMPDSQKRYKEYATKLGIRVLYS